MNVLIAAAEAVPFAKVGGMADVLGSLPAALRKLGADVRLIMPCFGFIDKLAHHFKLYSSFHYEFAGELLDVRIFSTTYQDVPYYMIEAMPYFGEDSAVYAADMVEDLTRYTLFNYLILETVARHIHLDHWSPDVIHLNDWHTALTPYLINCGATPVRNLPSILTLHNPAYQGGGAQRLSQDLLPKPDHPDLVNLDLTGNFLAIGVAYADRINTVSERFAEELRQAPGQGGFSALLKRRGHDFTGILNGLDTDLWDPSQGQDLVSAFDAYQFLSERAANKAALQKSCGLEAVEELPLAGMVTRIVAQKGIDLVTDALDQLDNLPPFQLVVLGSGDPMLEGRLQYLADKHPNRIRVFLQFDESLARRIYGGVDLFLMPSRFEPCGIGQMIAMRYGALPVVHQTGGLADTVMDQAAHPNQPGTGFVFTGDSENAFQTALHRALCFWRDQRQEWRRMQHHAMLCDFSWSESARRYMKMYLSVLDDGEEDPS